MSYNQTLTHDLEQSIIKSLIVSPEIIGDIISLLKVDDFIVKEHQIILATILDQYNNERPVSNKTIMLHNSKIDENVYKSIINTQPLSELKQHILELKNARISRQLITTAAKIQNGDFKHIDKLQELQQQQKSLFDSSNTLGTFDVKFESLISSLDLNVEKIKNKKIEYLLENFITKNDIVMIVGRPGTGKTYVAVSICNMLLLENKINRIFYLDGDNSELTIFVRNIHLLKQKYENRFNYFVELSRAALLQLLQELKRKNLTNCLIVLDSIKHFLEGDRNNHKDVSNLMYELKTLRKNGATVMFLHHQNKLNRDFNSDFAGSSAFAEDVAMTFMLTKNEDKKAFILEPKKDRDSVAKPIAFTYNMDNTLTRVDIDWAKETNEELEIRNEIITLIGTNKPNYSEILNTLVDAGYNKDKANKVIQNGKDKYWKATRVPRQNNKLVFELIENKDSQDNSVNKGLQ